jgi:hypothetical protein
VNFTTEGKRDSPRRGREIHHGGEERFTTEDTESTEEKTEEERRRLRKRGEDRGREKRSK